MANSIILTVTGKDRPGLVDDISSMVTEQSGNWLESRVTKLSGHFAGIIRVSVPSKNQEKLESDLKTLETSDFHLAIERQTKAEAEVPVRELSLEIVGPDHPGIIQDISHALAEKKIGINEMLTDCNDGAMSSERIFSAEINISIPMAVSVDTLRDELEELADQLMVDISMDDLEGTVTRI
ncbi:glycine cleavage system protein R [Kiloniella sp.]|uniref:glycine cleavage system protein R n=1 Tax=Kiloniella sp. TaxID=1938587 RepID=UPI003B0148D4